MKKSLVLAMAMALGVTASAYAANPFSDVPAGHWAYDSISKLAAAGVIEGYGDDTFRGDRLMTRYEMAQIVAKAMAKGANVDKLIAEFADELDALGVRVAALEKKSDNVKITGNIRWNFAHSENKTHEGTTKSDAHKLRSRLTFTGTINDNWKYVGLLENIQDFKTDTGDETTNWQRAYLEGRLGGLKMRAGRYNMTRTDEGLIYDNRFDGIEATYGDKVKLQAYYGKPTALNSAEKVGKAFEDKAGTEEMKDGKGNTLAALTAAKTKFDRAWGINAAGQIGKNLTLFAGYDKFEPRTDGVGLGAKDADGEVIGADDLGIFDVGLRGKFGKVGANFTYLHGKSDEVINKNGYVFGLTYAGAVATKPGSWGLAANYYNQGDGTYLKHTMNGDPDTNMTGGFKGYMLAGYYTLAKGMVAGIEWYDLKSKEGDNKNKTLWAQMVVTF